jgi:hypothetical protein
MNRFFDIVSGMGFLILVYLFLNNGQSTVSIIQTIGSNTTSGIRTLQGR